MNKLKKFIAHFIARVPFKYYIRFSPFSFLSFLTNDDPYLVDGARDETSDVLLLPEDEWERGGEGGRGLDRGEHDLADIGAVVEAEDALHLVERHVLHHVDHVLVELAADVPMGIEAL